MTARGHRTQPRRVAPTRLRVLAAGGRRTLALVVALLAAGAGGAACTRAAAPAGARPVAPADAGAASATAAVEGFVAAARVNDARSMGLLFGTAAGPVAGRDPQADVEKRMRALACYLTHDSARVVDDLPAVAAGNRRLVTVALRQRELARETRFTVVPTARGRWLVEAFDIERLSDFCRPG
jgi:hypothetical protein